MTFNQALLPVHVPQNSLLKLMNSGCFLPVTTTILYHCKTTTTKCPKCEAPNSQRESTEARQTYAHH
uniref:Uncharacterized protein n=1 Tax=Anguilla anguilla TaxID=7936 RepID=A0A0E9WLI0_ANGAN